MDFGFLGLDGFGSETTPTAAETKQKLYGSGFFKQERSSCTDEDDYRCSKLVKTEDSSASKSMRSRFNTSIFPDVQQNQQMLSFSSPKLEDKCSPNVTFPYFHLTPPAFTRNPGYNNNGVFQAANMHGVFSGSRGPFTPSQWMELEQQALIFKCLANNTPIPPHLLFPIRKAYDSVDFSGFSGGYFRPNALGWPFNLGFANSTDPEPGRCRRTDGKKWRCSRDAVPDQKYCERHLNRGRHRSRKPVESKSGHSAAVSNINSTKLMSNASSSPVVGANSGGGASSSLTIAQQQHLNTFQAGIASNLSTAASFNRNPFEEATRNDFGVVSSDSLLNPSHKGYPMIDIKNFSSSSQETDSQHSLRQFMDDWPKDVHSDRTQLSISVPLAASDFMSSTSSPNNEKVSLSPLRLSREFDPIQMGLGVGTVINEPNHRQTDWIPIPWENSMGGPLGEVLHSTSNNSTADCKNSSPLNLMTEGWDHSPRLGSSPTGVLQKSTFVSLSNSSAGSSPRAENNKTLCNDLGSTIVHLSLPEI